jgi:hypothetical protein
MAHNLLNHTLARSVRLLLDYVSAIAKFLQLGFDSLKPVQGWPAVLAENEHRIGVFENGIGTLPHKVERGFYGLSRPSGEIAKVGT